MYVLVFAVISVQGTTTFLQSSYEGQPLVIMTLNIAKKIFDHDEYVLLSHPIDGVDVDSVL